MLLLPVDSTGARVITVNTGYDILSFRTYYMAGEEPLWLCDIYDAAGNELITGLALVPGSDNILKGQGDKLEKYQLYVLLTDNQPGDLDALGKYLQLILYLPGEVNDNIPGDPLLTVGTDWVWS